MHNFLATSLEILSIHVVDSVYLSRNPLRPKYLLHGENVSSARRLAQKASIGIRRIPNSIPYAITTPKALS